MTMDVNFNDGLMVAEMDDFKLLYLGNHEDLRNGVGHFCSQSDADPKSRNRFRIGAN